MSNFLKLNYFKAGVFGCGCWADSSAGIASSTSGVGEYLIKTNLAKTLAQDIQNATVFPAEALQHSMTNNFLSKNLFNILIQLLLILFNIYAF